MLPSLQRWLVDPAPSSLLCTTSVCCRPTDQPVAGNRPNPRARQQRSPGGHMLIPCAWMYDPGVPSPPEQRHCIHPLPHVTIQRAGLGCLLLMEGNPRQFLGTARSTANSYTKETSYTPLTRKTILHAPAFSLCRLPAWMAVSRDRNLSCLPAGGWCDL